MRNPEFANRILPPFLLLFILTPAVQDQTFAQSTTMMKPAEAYKVLKQHNDEMKLVPNLAGPVSYNDLRAKNCFGVRLASNQMFLGESTGEDYDLTFYGPGGALTGRVIGFLCSDAAFIVQDKHFAPGSYAVLLNQEMITIAGDNLEGESLLLSAKVDAAALTAKKRPKFSFLQEGDLVFLAVLGDKFNLRPEERKIE